MARRTSASRDLPDSTSPRAQACAPVLTIPSTYYLLTSTWVMLVRSLFKGCADAARRTQRVPSCRGCSSSVARLPGRRLTLTSSYTWSWASLCSACRAGCSPRRIAWTKRRRSCRSGWTTTWKIAYGGGSGCYCGRRSWRNPQGSPLRRVRSSERRSAPSMRSPCRRWQQLGRRWCRDRRRWIRGLRCLKAAKRRPSQYSEPAAAPTCVMSVVVCWRIRPTRGCLLAHGCPVRGAHAP